MELQNQDNWELNKENIVPLISGRSAKTLISSLKRNDAKNIANIKSEFETRIENNSNNKELLLELWFDYINWHEQAITTGKDAKNLIEKALMELDQSSELFQHEKYLKLWLKYACLLDEKEETFSYLLANGIGYEQSILYSTYAYFCELSEQYNKADDIFMLGINRSAKPLEELKQNYADFLHRLAENKKTNLNLSEGSTSSSRTAFTDIAIPKTGITLVDRVTNLQIAKPLSSGNEVRAHFEFSTQSTQKDIIFVDHAHHSTTSTQPVEWSRPLVKSQIDRDNIIDPTTWDVAKISSKTNNLLPVKQEMTIQGIFQDEYSVKLSKNRCYLLQPSTPPFLLQNEAKTPWIIATEHECISAGIEYSMEEFMSLRYHHLQNNKLGYPVKHQLLARVQEMPKRLRIFIEF